MGGQHRKTDRHMTEVDLGVASHSSDMKLSAQLCVKRAIHVETVARTVSRTSIVCDKFEREWIGRRADRTIKVMSEVRSEK